MVLRSRNELARNRLYRKLGCSNALPGSKWRFMRWLHFLFHRRQGRPAARDQNISVSLVWPATGLAIAALLLLGQRVWPAIAVGAFLVNFSTTGADCFIAGDRRGQRRSRRTSPPWTARRWANGWRAFERAQDILRFAVFRRFPCDAAQRHPRRGQPVDVRSRPRSRLLCPVGQLVAQPCGRSICCHSPHRVDGHAASAALDDAAVGGSHLSCSAAFSSSGTSCLAGWSSQNTNYPLTFIYIPFLFWTAFRFGPREASLATFIIAVLAIAGTFQGQGRFAVLPQEQSLMLAPAFLGVVALTTLSVSASVSEKQTPGGTGFATGRHRRILLRRHRRQDHQRHHRQLE